MNLRIDSADYNVFQRKTPTYVKLQTQRYTIAGSADYVAIGVVNTAWQYTVVVSASASALGGGVSAGGLDSLRTSFSKTTALTMVSDDAVTATAWFTKLATQEQVNPTWFVMNLELVRAV
jgi:hypothetical protein